MTRNVWWLIPSHPDQLHAFVLKVQYLEAMESVPKVWGNIWWNLSSPLLGILVLTLSIFFILVQVRPQCTVNEDCPYSDICQLGNCIDACRATKCGTNAICTSSNHRAECSCVHGFQGDPFTACRPCKKIIVKLSSVFVGRILQRCMTACCSFSVPPPTEPSLDVGCSTNDECPDYTACENRQCINPCAYKNPCAPTAHCRVVRHNPICTCPDGYVGSPTTSCQLRKTFTCSRSKLNA